MTIKSAKSPKSTGKDEGHKKSDLVVTERLAVLILLAAGVVVSICGCGGSSARPMPAQIAFSSNRAFDGSNSMNTNSTLNIWVMNVDGSNAQPLTQLDVPVFIDFGCHPPCFRTADSMRPLWSLGGRLAFQSSRALDGTNNLNTQGDENIWVMNADGSGAMPVTQPSAFNAVWSPDGTRIVLQSFQSLDGLFHGLAHSNIWVINPDGSGLSLLTQLTYFPAISSEPVWSPDGSKVAFRSDRALDGSNNSAGTDGNGNVIFNLWVMNSDGSGAKVLARLSHLDLFFELDSGFYEPPVWSPDGSKIAFRSRLALDGSDNGIIGSVPANIWVVNADGSGAKPLTQLTAGPADSVHPVWSPDGSKIVFQSMRALDGSDKVNINFTSNVWAMNADGSNTKPMTQITVFAAGSRDPVWSPDGSQIAFSSGRALDGSDSLNAAINIWVVNADGSNAKPLTQLTVPNTSCSQPAWWPGH